MLTLPQPRGFACHTQVNKRVELCCVGAMLEGPMGRSLTSLKQSHHFHLLLLRYTKENFRQLNLSNVVVLVKIIHLLPLETNLFVGVLVRVSSKMQSETTIVPWSMLETAQTNTDKLCWPLESTTVEIFTNGRGVPAAFIH